MISDSLSIGANALQAFSVGIQVAAHNLANCSTQGFSPQHATFSNRPGNAGVQLEAVMPDHTPELAPDHSGTDLAKELSLMIVNQRGFEANAKTVAAADELLGNLLNLSA